MRTLPFTYAVTYKHGDTTGCTEISVDRQITDTRPVADGIARDLGMRVGSVKVLGYELVRSPGGAA